MMWRDCQDKLQILKSNSVKEYVTFCVRMCVICNNVKVKIYATFCVRMWCWIFVGPLHIGTDIGL